jgi:hypothetical protein
MNYRKILTPFVINGTALKTDFDAISKIDLAMIPLSRYNQIGLTYENENAKNKFYDGVGSLDYDYNNWDEADMLAGLPPPANTRKLNELDFNKIVPELKGMYTYELLSDLKKYYNIGRTRFMVMKSKTCLTWHLDSTPRMHIPVFTNEQCKMVWDDKTLSMEDGNLYWVNTTIPHTAFNGSYVDRIHMVMTVDN